MNRARVSKQFSVENNGTTSDNGAGERYYELRLPVIIVYSLVLLALAFISFAIYTHSRVQKIILDLQAPSS
jgi:hypothetical protein